MRDLTFSFYKHKRDNKTQIITKSWEDWVTIFTTHKTRGTPEDTNNLEALNSAKDGPALILGDVGDTRSANNVNSIHALGLDIDNSTYEQIKSILDKLSQYEYVLYTTHKHGSQISPNPRIRVILPLQEPISPQDHSKAWSALQELSGGAIDESTKDCSRLNFLPSTFDLSVARTQHNKGRWISPDDIIKKNDGNLDQSLEKSILSQEVSAAQAVLNVIRKTDPLKEPAQALLKGEPYAQPGSIHQTTLDLTMFLAQKRPHLTDQSLQLLFKPSLLTMGMDLNKEFYEITRAFEGAKRKLLEKLQVVKSGSGYTDEELRLIAQKQNCTVQDLEKRWIIQKDGGGWVLNQDGEYYGYFSYRDFPIVMRKYLCRAPIELFEPTQNGYKRKNSEEITAFYGDVAKRVISDMSKQYTVFNPKNHTIYEAVTPLRNLEPKFDPRLDQWLKYLFAKNYDKGLNWMAVCPDLTKQLCGIYFDGPKDSGKTIFALGMAKLWTEGAPGNIALVLSDFNEELVRCPLVLADEEMPQKFPRQAITTKLRSMLSTTSRTLRRLYTPPSELEGAIRLILAANNDSLLFSNELHTTNDLEAIAQRFMYVPVSEEARKYLATLSRETTGGWIESGIAQHALWLAQNHDIQISGNRFAVEGDIAEMHRLLLVGAPWSSLVCEWLVRYLLEPKAFDNEVTGLIQRKDGKLFVNNQALVKHWDLYLKDRKERADTRKIGTAIKTLLVSQDRIQMRFGGKQIWYKEIDTTHLFHWMKEYNIGHEDDIKTTLNTPVTDDPEDLKVSSIKTNDRSERLGFGEY